MKSLKGRLLKSFSSNQSIYTSKQHVVRESPERFSSCQNLENLPSYTQQEEITNYSLDLESEIAHKMSSDSLEPTKEIDVFEDCECGFDDPIPEMVSSTSSSSSSSSNCSPTRKNYEDIMDMGNLQSFQERCPPGGEDKVILYTTSLRGIRKTYEDCYATKVLLESFRVMYIERDVSMHLKFKDELWEVLGDRVVPPRLFIKGRYIGGADVVVMLHEVAMLKNLLQGIPVCPLTSDLKCCQCGGDRFLLCSDCCGSCKVYKDDQRKNEGSLFVRCTKCNENGLIKCPTCSI